MAFTCLKCGILTRNRKFCSRRCGNQFNAALRTKESFLDSRGYKLIKIDSKWKREHVLIAEQVLGRRLKQDEIVHHINAIKSDNRNSNLLICTRSYHLWLHQKMSEIYQKEHFVG